MLLKILLALTLYQKISIVSALIHETCISVDNNQDQKEKTLLISALSLAWQLGYTIVIPLIIFALGGRFLDRRFETSPVFFLIGLVLSVIITLAWLMIKMSQFTRDMNKKDSDQKKV